VEKVKELLHQEGQEVQVEVVDQDLLDLQLLIQLLQAEPVILQTHLQVRAILAVVEELQVVQLAHHIVDYQVEVEVEQVKMVLMA
jgi:hypothetical protein